MTNQEIVIKFLNGFNNPEQIHKSLDLLADDYSFKNPLIMLDSKASFLTLAEQISEVILGVDIMNIAQKGNWVSVLYSFTSSVPGLESNLATEWFRIEKEIIKESLLIYDTYKWREFYKQMEK